MKKLLKFLIVVFLLGSFAPAKAVVTYSGTFPTALSNFQDGNIIRSGDWGNIENTIGQKSTTSPLALWGFVYQYYATTTQPNITTLAALAAFGASGATTTASSGVSAAGLASSAGLTISAGSILNTSSGTSTFTNGIVLNGGCIYVTAQSACLGSGGSGITSLNGLSGASQTFSAAIGQNTNLDISSSGTAHTFKLIDDVTPDFLTFAATSTTATSTISFGLAAISAVGVGGTATTTILGNNSTSTFAGGVNTTGLSSTNGLTITGGNILSSGVLQITNTSTSTFAGGINIGTTGGLSSASGLTITGGNILSSGLLTITNAGTSTFSGGISSAGLASSLGLTLTGGSVICTTCIPNASLLNSTISGISLGSNLANLTATDSTLTFSGTYTGATARTIGLNLGTANTWTSATTTFQSGLVVSSLTGALGIGTTTFNGKLVVDGGQAYVQEYRIPSSATPAINWNNSNNQIMIMTANVTAVTMAGGYNGAKYQLELCQDSTGNRTAIGWGANILFYTGDLTNGTSTPGLTTKGGTCNIFTFNVSGGTSTPIYQGTLPLKGK